MRTDGRPGTAGTVQRVPSGEGSVLCILGLRLRGDPACGEGKPRALRCRDVPTAVGSLSSFTI
jgi:hypothetical protein